MKHLLSKYRLHIIFWLLYFIFWTIDSAIVYHNPYWLAFIFTIFWFIGQAGASYLSLYWLIPRYLATKRYVLFTLLVIAVLAVAAAFVTAASIGIMRLRGETVPYPYGREFLYSLIGAFYMAFLVVSLKTIKDRLQTERRHALLEKEKTENELRFLKSQMNPHFLFNAINSIYALIRKDPDFAALTLVKFADMLRYQLYECNVDEIPIEKEISYLDNYIELEKLRKGHIIKTQYNVSASTCNFSIAPLLIIPFVENAFKYVSTCSDKRNFVTVDLSFQDDIFELSVENTVDEDIPQPKQRSWGGIGLENVRRRLELMYKGRYALDISRSGDIYSVLLTIKIR